MNILKSRLWFYLLAGQWVFCILFLLDPNVPQLVAYPYFIWCLLNTVGWFIYKEGKHV